MAEEGDGNRSEEDEVCYIGTYKSSELQRVAASEQTSVVHVTNDGEDCAIEEVLEVVVRPPKTEINIDSIVALYESMPGKSEKCEEGGNNRRRRRPRTRRNQSPKADFDFLGTKAVQDIDKLVEQYDTQFQSQTEIKYRLNIERHNNRKMILKYLLLGVEELRHHLQIGDLVLTESEEEIIKIDTVYDHVRNITKQMEDYLFSQLNKRSYSVLEVEYKSRVKAIVENMKDVDNFELRRKLLGRKIKLEFLTFGPLSLLQSQAIRDKLENEQKRILAEASFEYEQKLKEKLELEKEEGRKSEAEVNEYEIEKKESTDKEEVKEVDPTDEEVNDRELKLRQTIAKWEAEFGWNLIDKLRDQVLDIFGESEISARLLKSIDEI